jgi:signal transduction histidine kinase
MKSYLTALCICFWFLSGWEAKGQKDIASVKISSVKAKSNQKDSVTIVVNSSQKESVKLPFNQNYLLFNLVNTHHSSQQLSFVYKLVGLDYYWFSCDHCSQVQYAHLDGGAYTFLAKTTEPDAVPAEFRFVIEENIWNQWWFVPTLLLYCLGLIGLGIYFFVLYQFRQKLKEQRLVHKAKMDSMAELTAGIAHEIQNPLNFVNNFSEVSAELVEELKEELDRGDLVEAKAITDDLGQNLEKITSHGKRAGAIVKGMLEHSRTSSGQKEPTDLNKLVNECLKLAYQSLRAKDKDFSADLRLNLDPKLRPIDVIPQEIGRVLLNLYNNAFYAIQQRQQTGNARENNPSGQSDYQPQIDVTTHLENGKVAVRVKDNGMGIPEEILNKIFQPFFTTKPSGQGTGLGLSLAYDIITKGHGGSLTVASSQGHFTEFLISLPA